MTTIYEFHTDFHSYRLETANFIPYVIQSKFRLNNDYSYKIQSAYQTRETADRYFARLFTKKTGRPWAEYEDYQANTPPPFRMGSE